MGFVTGYFTTKLPYTRCYTKKCISWLIFTRCLSSSVLYTLAERLLFLKFSQPSKYTLSASSGIFCGSAFGLYGECL